jgi:Zn-dependent M28 family amino/carboxypeptidase
LTRRPKSSPVKSLWKSKTLWAAMVVAGAITALLGWSEWASSQQQVGPLGTAAMEHVKALVALGPRPVGSEAHLAMQRYITDQLQASGASVEPISFSVSTPQGEMGLTNIVGRMGKPGGRIIVLATHYETVKMDGFVGANDGGSSTGLLLALAPLLGRQNLQHEIRLVFFDGEEAFEKWSETDSLYGSRHLAAQWKADGTASRIGAFLLLDMIGDSDLNLQQDSNSTPWLRDQVWKVAARLGYGRYFTNDSLGVEDDHLPFIRVGVPVVDLIDLDFGPNNRYHHTLDDTLDKVSPRSMQIVGEVVLETIAELDRQH